MTYVNKNMALHKLKELVEVNLNSRVQYMPESFNVQQQLALELFTKRIFLEEVIDESISFNKTISWECNDVNLGITTTAEELIKVFKLRSEVYTQINYQKEFPDTIEGLNFDIFDKNSAILYYQANNEVTGTTRLIFDSSNKLPSEEKYSFDEGRKKYNNIGEVSRLIIRQDNKGLNQGFKNLVKGLNIVFDNNKIDMTLSGIKKEHFQFYARLGGASIEAELESYGKVDVPCVIMAWNLSEVKSKYLK